MNDWIASLDWGSVPDWFAAIGTVGALLATLYIVRKDAWTRRRTQVEQLTLVSGKFVERGENTVKAEIVVFVHNTSPAPILSVSFIGPDAIRRETGKPGTEDAMICKQFLPNVHKQFHALQNGLESIEMLEPGKTMSMRILTTEESTGPWYASVTDARGLTWILNALTSELIPTRKAKRILAHANHQAVDHYN